MDVRSKLKIWKTANDNYEMPGVVFGAQSRIRRRVGFFDPEVPGMDHCNRMICSALSHYRFLVDGYNQPRMHEHWKASREEKIEDALTYLEEVLDRQGIQVS
jgi:hypothetical protein